MKFALTFLIFICALISVHAQTVELRISGIRDTKGHILLGIFIDDESFQQEKPFMKKKFPKTGMTNGEMTVVFGLEPGVYGFSLLDDENEDGKMEYNFIGIPREGFGFSNYYHKALTRPGFEDFKFELKKNEKAKVVMKIRYI